MVMVSYHGALWCVQSCDIEGVAWCIVHGSLFLKRRRGVLFIAKEVLGLRLGLSPNPN